MTRPAPPATGAQARAWRGAVRRLDLALVERDPHADRDPEHTRRRAVVVGALLAALGLAAAAVVGLVRGDTVAGGPAAALPAPGPGAAREAYGDLEHGAAAATL